MRAIVSGLLGLVSITFCLQAEERDVPAIYEQTEELKIVETYEQDELLKLIADNTHLQRVKSDRCQLNQDIEANASVLKIPAYQFLWGDMLAWGVCVDTDPELGLVYIKHAADQGLSEAHEQLGRYYNKGIFVAQNTVKAVRHLSTAAYSNNIKALLQLTDIYLSGSGSPIDFEDVYRLLCLAVVDDKQQLKSLKLRKSQLAELLPASVVKRINRETDQ